MTSQHALIAQVEALTDENAHTDALIAVAQFYARHGGIMRAHFQQYERQLAQLRTAHHDIGHLTDPMYRERADVRADLRRMIGDIDAAAPILAHF